MWSVVDGNRGTGCEAEPGRKVPIAGARGGQRREFRRGGGELDGRQARPSPCRVNQLSAGKRGRRLHAATDWSSKSMASRIPYIRCSDHSIAHLLQRTPRTCGTLRSRKRSELARRADARADSHVSRAS